jgi:hypothetical protein
VENYFDKKFCYHLPVSGYLHSLSSHSCSDLDMAVDFLLLAAFMNIKYYLIIKIIITLSGAIYS